MAARLFPEEKEKPQDDFRSGRPERRRGQWLSGNLLERMRIQKLVERASIFVPSGREERKESDSGRGEKFKTHAQLFQKTRKFHLSIRLSMIAALYLLFNEIAAFIGRFIPRIKKRKGFPMSRSLAYFND